MSRMTNMYGLSVPDRPRPSGVRVLLDFDGVVLKNHPIQQRVGQLCTQFVEKRTKLKKSATVLNKNLYSAYGHTVLGLNALGYETSKDEFNEFVYGQINYEDFRDIRDTHCSDVLEYKRVYEWFRGQSRYDLTIFSNAPDLWTSTISRMMIDEEVPSLAGQMGEFFKPQRECYDAVDKAHGSAHGSGSIVFLDDNLMNVVESPESWKSLLYCPKIDMLDQLAR